MGKKNGKVHLSGTQLIDSRRLKNELDDKITEKVLKIHTDAFFLALECVLRSNGLSQKATDNVMSLVDEEMGKYNSLGTLEAYRSNIVERYGFDVRS